MKKVEFVLYFFGVALLCALISTDAYAQVNRPVTRIHLFNVQNGFSLAVKTTTTANSPIQIKRRTWAIIQTTADSVGFIVNNKPYYVHFSPGKQHYFIATLGSLPGSYTVVSETNEQEFIMTVSINNARGPEEYNLDKLNN
ncbi:hypothetical protein [Spirosoma aerophilum]